MRASKRMRAQAQRDAAAARRLEEDLNEVSCAEKEAVELQNEPDEQDPPLPSPRRVGSFFFIPLYVDPSIPPGVIEIRNVCTGETGVIKNMISCPATSDNNS